MKLSPSQKLLAAQEAGPVPLTQFGVADTSVASTDYEESVPRLLLLEDECLPSIQSGYCDNGQSVQEGDQILSDRATGPQDGIQILDVFSVCLLVVDMMSTIEIEIWLVFARCHIVRK